MATAARTTAAIGTDWRVHGVSVQGYSHLRDGRECQDAYRAGYVESAGAHVLAVADGAGSRARSAEGATLAVGLAVRALSDGLERRGGGVPGDADAWHALLENAYAEVHSAFARVTASLGPEPKEFAATLTAVVLAAPWIGVITLGDGFVVARAGEPGHERFHLLAHEDGASEYVNETVFLTSRSARSAVVVCCAYDPEVSAVVLATDGLAGAGIRQVSARRVPNPAFLEPVLASLDDPTRIARFLLDDKLTEVSADDKTLLMAVPR
jgi:hypothetical protein